MRREPPQHLSDYMPILFPALMLIVFFVVPFGTMIAVSFFKRQAGGFYTTDFVLDNYARFISTFFGGVLSFSVGLSILVAVCCVILALPFTYLLTRMQKQVQVVWLVALLSILSLSEVIISCLVNFVLPHGRYYQYFGSVRADAGTCGIDAEFWCRFDRNGLSGISLYSVSFISCTCAS